MPSAIDLCIIADVKSYAGISAGDTSNDTVLARLITAASQRVLTMTGRDTFLVTTYTERRNGNGGGKIIPFHSPLRSVVSVGVNTITIPVSPDGVTAGWIADKRAVYLVDYRFTSGRQNITLVYTAGFDAVPSDIADGVIVGVTTVFKRRTHLDKDSESLNGQSVTFSKSDFPPSFLRDISNYTTWVLE